MKHTCLVQGLCTLAVIAAVFTGCSSSGGGDATDYVALSAGTWQTSTSTVYSYYTVTDTDTLVINADGTFSRIEVTFHDYSSSYSTDTYSSDAYTGTVSASADAITFTNKLYYTSSTNMTSIPTTGGKEDTESSTMPYFIKDGTLYTNIFTRQGSGTGIIGTWLKKYSNSSVYSGYVLVTDYTDTMSVTSSAITVDTQDAWYYKEYPANKYTDSSSKNYTYTVIDGTTIAVTQSGYSTSAKWPYEISGDSLIIKNADSTWTKK